MQKGSASIKVSEMAKHMMLAMREHELIQSFPSEFCHINTTHDFTLFQPLKKALIRRLLNFFTTCRPKCRTERKTHKIQKTSIFRVKDQLIKRSKKTKHATKWPEE